jgi:hypothetical protein
MKGISKSRLAGGLAPLLMAVPLASCGEGTPPPAVAPAPPPPPRPALYGPVGLERVMGKNAAALTSLFGKPDADVTEGTGRKLQFTSAICVLDAYLYPRGGGTPVVTYVDARQTNGSPIDRASCVAALTRRAGGR